MERLIVYFGIRPAIVGEGRTTVQVGSSRSCTSIMSQRSSPQKARGSSFEIRPRRNEPQGLTLLFFFKKIKNNIHTTKHDFQRQDKSRQYLLLVVYSSSSGGNSIRYALQTSQLGCPSFHETVSIVARVL